jgi:hypothetical protein
MSKKGWGAGFECLIDMDEVGGRTAGSPILADHGSAIDVARQVASLSEEVAAKDREIADLRAHNAELTAAHDAGHPVPPPTTLPPPSTPSSL